MSIACAVNKEIFAPLGAKPERRLAAKDLNVSGSHKHFAPTARERESAKYPTVCERCVTALDEIEKEAD